MAMEYCTRIDIGEWKGGAFAPVSPPGEGWTLFSVVVASAATTDDVENLYYTWQREVEEG